MTANIIVAVPAYGGSLKNDCAITLLKLAAAGQRNKLALSFKILDRLGIEMMRNVFTSLLYQERAFTHLFFVDSDMAFEPSALLRLLQADKPIIGCACAKRHIDLSKVRAGESGLTYTLYFRKDENTLRTEGSGLCKVDGIGMGVTLIRRDAVEQLVASGRLATKSPGLFADIPVKPIYGFFDPLTIDGRDLSEDLAFCRRWQDYCDGEVWALIDEEISHIGPFAYRGRLSDALKLRK